MPEVSIGDGRDGKANGGESGREEVLAGKVVERWYQLAFREVATGTEDDECTAVFGPLQELI